MKFVRFDSKICNSIDSKGKKYSKNSMKINLKFVRFDSIYKVESNFSDAEFVRNLFNSIQKMIRLIRKVKNNLKNSIKINSTFVRFDSTSTIFCDVLTSVNFLNVLSIYTTFYMKWMNIFVCLRQGKINASVGKKA